jgi:hypothetical protein
MQSHSTKGNLTRDEIRMTEICMMSSVVEVHAARLKIGARSMSALNKSSVKKGTMATTVPITTNFTDSVLPKGPQCRRSQDFFPRLEDGALAPELQTIGD